MYSWEKALGGKGKMIKSSLRGIILRESLISEKLPTGLEEYIINTQSITLDDLGKKVEALTVNIPKSDLPGFALALANDLRPTGYYSHFVENNDRLYIIYPKTICIADRNNKETIAQCKKIGGIYSIPENQMPFESMFYEDHPKNDALLVYFRRYG